ncbi:MAG: hypothetical protein JNL80_04010 [Phycisphaerae bacterium]|nr:hypothetical protein [Phycisphaerae bacterium]
MALPSRLATPLLILAALLAGNLSAVLSADESLLPAPLQAGRLDALLERAGAGDLRIEERRSIAQIYAAYAAQYALLRDSRAERWSQELDDLFSLRTPPGEKALRHLLTEHRSLCDRAAALDRSLLDDIAPLVGSDVDLDRVRALRDVDRWAQTMPLQTAVGTRGDLWSICRHLDLSDAETTLVAEALRDRDLALPGLVQRVWTSWRDLLLAASKSFEAETGGVLPAIGAALSDEEARRLRDRITQGCSTEAEACRSARQRVRELDRKTIDRIIAAIPASESAELRLRLLSARGVSMSSLVVNVEACYRCARRHFAEPHPLASALETSYRGWNDAWTKLAAEDLATRDAAQDRGILEPSRFGDAFIDGSEDVHRVSLALLAETNRALRELALMLQPFADTLRGSGVSLRLVTTTSADGSVSEVPWVSSTGWQRSASASFARTPAEVAAAERSASILMTRRGGIAPPMTREWIASRLPKLIDASTLERWEAAMVRHVDEAKRDVEDPLRAVMDDALGIRNRVGGDGAESNEDGIRQCIARRDDLFFVSERLDERLFQELVDALPRGADRRAIEDARAERAIDRELPCVQLMMLSTANPWTALQDTDLEAPAAERIRETLRDAMRWFMPDLRRSRAAEFASSSATDVAIIRSGVGVAMTHSESLARASYEADRLLERSFESLLNSLLESANEARELFAASYARLTMLPEAPWSPATQAIINGIGGLGIADDRMRECHGRIAALAADVNRSSLERAMVRAGVKSVRSRSDEAARLDRLRHAIDDQLRTELLGLLKSEERRILTATDQLDRLLACDEDVDEESPAANDPASP